MLALNVLIEWFDLPVAKAPLPADAETVLPRIDRVLWIDTQEVVLIDIYKKGSLPRWEMRAEIEADITAGQAHILKSDPYNYLRRADSAIPDDHCKKRDDIWENYVRRLVQTETGQPNLKTFDKKYRGKMIAKISVETGRQKWLIYAYVRRYWQRGQMKNACLPDWDKSGAKGVRKKCTDEKPDDKKPDDKKLSKKKLDDKKTDEKKLGRPSHIMLKEGNDYGINVDDTIRRDFRSGIQLYYLTPEQTPLTRAFELMLQKFFISGYEINQGVPTPILLPAEKLPTFGQFRYWYEQDLEIKRELIKRRGERHFNLNDRALLGNATATAFGPTSLYQIDAAFGRTELVMRTDPTKRIGNPIIYLVVDTFSRMIVGFAVTLDKGPKWTGAMLAMENAMTEKTEFCKKYDIKIEPEDWPCYYLPAQYLADRGEMEGYNADQLVNGLGIQVTNTAPYRADSKPFVEESFGMVNARGVLELPGAEKKNRDTRGERDSRIDACLTLTEFIKIIIHIILNHNSYHHFKDYPFTEEMIRNRVEPYPIELWNWGLQNRIGAPRTLPADVIYKNVLPSDTASITGNGILYEGLYYYCEWADQKDWFVTARKGGRWHETISYDSRLVDVIYLHIDRQGEMQPCTLTEKSDMFVGWSWEEYKLYREDKKMRDSKAKAENYQHRVDTDAQINAIVVPAKKRKQKALEVTPKSRRELLSGKSENRTEERASENANFRIGNVPVPNNTPASVEDKDQPEINAFTPVERPRNIEDLLKKQRQKLDRQEIDTQSEVDNG